MVSFDTLLQDLRRTVAEIEPAALAAALAGGEPPTVLDVREADEHAQGAIAGAIHVPRGSLELRIERLVPDRARPLAVYCAGGTRSLLAVRSLAELGYPAARSLAGGFTAWKRAGLPWAIPRALRPEQVARYARHTLLPEVGVDGQLALLAARVLCIGAGGLGSPASMYLAAAGVGTLGVIDDDVVDASNLQRQILHATDRIGVAKVDSAEQTLRGLNPDVRVDKHRVRLTAANALAVLGGYDVIVDGTDNFSTRYLVNDAAVLAGLGIALVLLFSGHHLDVAVRDLVMAVGAYVLARLTGITQGAVQLARS